MSGWVRLENTMPENLKTAPLSDRAFRLWVHSACYCSRNQTDGLVPTAVVCSLSRTATKRIVDELVAARLFRVAEGGYVVNDYLEYNPSRVRISELKDAAKKRTARWRGSDSGDEDVTHHETDHSHVTPHARDRTDPIPTLEVDVFSYWQERCRKPRAKLTRERRKKIGARVAEGFSVEDIKRGVDGAAANPPVVDGVVYDDLMSVCRNGAQLERYMERAAAPVIPLRRSEAVEKADAYRQFYSQESAS